MTTLAATDNIFIEQYVKSVAEGLKEIANAERKEILAEIKSHLGERVEELRAQGASDAAEQAIRALGEPTALACQFVEAARQQQASRSYAPWVLLRSAARLALTGAKGMLVFLVAFVGFGAAIGFFIAAILKPFIPKMGLWVGSFGMVWGVKSDAVAGHELLGQYFIPASIVLAFVFGSGCTLLLQRLMRPSKSVLLSA